MPLLFRVTAGATDEQHNTVGCGMYVIGDGACSAVARNVRSTGWCDAMDHTLPGIYGTRISPTGSLAIGSIVSKNHGRRKG